MGRDGGWLRMTAFPLAFRRLHAAGLIMSDFVEFPEQVYLDAGNVFEAVQRASSSDLRSRTRCAMMWFAQLAYEVDDSGGNKNAAKIAKVADRWDFSSVTPFRAARRDRSENPSIPLASIGERRRRNRAGIRRHRSGRLGNRGDRFRALSSARRTRTSGFQAAFRAAAPLDAQGKLSGPIGDAIARSSATEACRFSSPVIASARLSAFSPPTRWPRRAACAAARDLRLRHPLRPGGTTFQKRYNAASWRRDLPPGARA